MKLNIIIFLILSSTVLLSQSNYFIPPSLGGDSYYVIIEEINYANSNLDVGDEIAVFDDFGIGLISAVQFDGNFPIQIKCYLKTIILEDTLQGAIHGNPISFKYWDKSLNEEIPLEVTFTEGGKFGDGLLSVVSVIEIQTPVSVKKINSTQHKFNITSLKNYPNPFNSSTIVSFHLSEDLNLKVEIFNMVGQKLFTIAEKKYNQGNNQIKIDLNEHSSGTYIYRIFNKVNNRTNKIVYLK